MGETVLHAMGIGWHVGLVSFGCFCLTCLGKLQQYRPTDLQ